MRTRSLVVIALTFSCGALDAHAQRWTGTASCPEGRNPTTGATVSAFTIPATLTIERSHAVLERRGTGGEERSQGTVFLDGAIKLQGTGKLYDNNPQNTWTTSAALRLRGSDYVGNVTTKSTSGFTRACELALSRAPAAQGPTSASAQEPGTPETRKAASGSPSAASVAQEKTRRGHEELAVGGAANKKAQEPPSNDLAAHREPAREPKDTEIKTQSAPFATALALSCTSGEKVWDAITLFNDGTYLTLGGVKDSKDLVPLVWMTGTYTRHGDRISWKQLGVRKAILDENGWARGKVRVETVDELTNTGSDIYVIRNISTKNDGRELGAQRTQKDCKWVRNAAGIHEATQRRKAIPARIIQPAVDLATGRPLLESLCTQSGDREMARIDTDITRNTLVDAIDSAKARGYACTVRTEMAKSALKSTDDRVEGHSRNFGGYDGMPANIWNSYCSIYLVALKNVPADCL